MADFTEKNRQVFENMAGSYMDKFAEVARTICRQIQDRRLWISDQWTDTESGKGKELKMLEYACGPGAVSMTLAPFVSNVIGLDLSGNMVDEYNKNARKAGLSEKMSAQIGDLLTEPAATGLSGREFFGFDIVLVSMALHHFDDAGKALKSLGQRLKKGGTCIIVDLVPDNSSHQHFHQHFGEETAATVRTHGFTQEQMEELFVGAELDVGFGYQVVGEPVVFHKDGNSIEKTIFVARARRP